MRRTLFTVNFAAEVPQILLDDEGGFNLFIWNGKSSYSSASMLSCYLRFHDGFMLRTQCRSVRFSTYQTR